MSDPEGESMMSPLSSHDSPPSHEKGPALKADTLLAAAGGAAAGLLYASLALLPLSLFPVQLVYGRFGREKGILAAASAFIVASASQILRFALAGSFGFADIGALVATPLVLFGAIAAINLRIWERLPATYRILASAIVCALAALPAVIALGRDEGLVAGLTAQLGRTFEPILGQIGGDSYEASALAAALDTRVLAEEAIRVFSSCFAAIIAFVLGLSVWAGNRLSGRGSPGREIAPPLSSYKAPYPLLWLFLGSWSTLLAAMLLRASGVLLAGLWNGALIFSLPFAAQGAGIAISLFAKWKLPRFMRFALTVTALLALFTPTSSLVVAIGLLLLGVTEVWIPYRNPKGVGA
jgi:hypothetical protein